MLNRVPSRPVLLAALSVTLLAAGSVSTAARQPHRKPDIVILLADDMGHADVGFNGCQDIPTPNIDALAKSGVRCANGYVSGVYCSPTRAGLLTGRYDETPAKLYNLLRDPGEAEDLTAAQAEKASQLQATWQQWNAQMVPPLWGGGAGRRNMDGE